MSKTKRTFVRCLPAYGIGICADRKLSDLEHVEDIFRLNEDPSNFHIFSTVRTMVSVWDALCPFKVQNAAARLGHGSRPSLVFPGGIIG